MSNEQLAPLLEALVGLANKKVDISVDNPNNRSVAFVKLVGILGNPEMDRGDVWVPVLVPSGDRVGFLFSPDSVQTWGQDTLGNVRLVANELAILIRPES